MAINIAKITQTARRLIRENGRKIVLVRMIRSIDPHGDPSAELVETVRAVQTAIAQSEIDGELVQQEDVRFMVPPPKILDGGISVGDIVRDGHDEYRVTLANPVRPGAQVAIWKITCRK